MQRLGQHFLRNGGAIKKILQAIEPETHETIIEIGPGHGELTLPLAKMCKERGCNVITIERDEELVARIVKHETIRGVSVVQGDALKLLPSLSSTLHALRFAIVGNIPYYITGKLLRTIGDLETKPSLSVLMVQKEVAERIVSGPPKMNRLAAAVQFWSEPSILASVPKENFHPEPKVDSAVLVLKTKTAQHLTHKEAYDRALRSLFQHPRKTILNNIGEHKEEGERKKISEKLLVEQIDPHDRPARLTIEHIGTIARLFFD